MIDIKNILIALVAGLVTGSLASGILIYRYEENRWQATISAQKIEAAAVLQEETEKVLAAERRNTELNTTIEVSHVAAQNRIDQTLDDNRRLARKLGGMRDPGRRPGGGCTEAGTHPSSDAAAAAPESRLSGEAEEFLLTLAADADRAAEYAIACHQWATTIIGENK
ncbi:MAG: hypothetical protein J0652_02530 [Desulfobulbaceae bacterium]|nr:hypothetical protein [Desulfobulbaceae bacterium]